MITKRDTRQALQDCGWNTTDLGATRRIRHTHLTIYPDGYFTIETYGEKHRGVFTHPLIAALFLVEVASWIEKNGTGGKTLEQLLDYKPWRGINAES